MSELRITDTTTLILTGGGMRCAWGGGFLYGLLKLGIHPETIIASSGNLGNAVYFIANRPESIKRIWTEHLPGKRFITYTRFKKIIDIDYLIDFVFSEKEPINWELIRKSTIKLICPLRDITNKEIRLFTNKDIDYQILRASKAMPILYGKKVNIETNDFNDYPFTPYELSNFTQNMAHIVIIDTREQNKIIKAFGSAFLGKKKEISVPQSLIHIKPNIHAHILTRSKKSLEKTFEEGYAFALSNFLKPK